MDHRNTFFGPMNPRFRHYGNQNIQNNPRNRHGNLRSNARISNRPHVHRTFPPAVLLEQWRQQWQQRRRLQRQHQPYYRNSWRRRPFWEQQHGGRYNLRNPRLNRYAHGWITDRNSNVNHVIPVLHPDFPNTSQLLNAHHQGGHGIPDQRQCCGCCHNVPLLRGYQPPNGYVGTSDTTDQEWDMNYGRGESNVVEEDDLAGPENHIQRENQRANTPVNVVHLHIDLYLQRPHDESDDEDQDQEPEERPDNDGLNQTTIKEYLSTKIHNQSANQEEAEICVVCQNEFEEEEVVGCLDCGHDYHEECITRWLLHKNFCPVCKRAAIPAARGGVVEIH